MPRNVLQMVELINANGVLVHAVVSVAMAQVTLLHVQMESLQLYQHQHLVLRPHLFRQPLQEPLIQFRFYMVMEQVIP
jgi:hypothetical protein